MTDETLPPLPEPRLEQHELELWGQNVLVDLFDGQQMRAYVLLDRQQRAAPSAEPVAWIESPHGAIRANPLYRLAPPPQSLAWRIPLYTTRPDHTALLRQALEALEERYIGALRDNAIDALRAALEPKQC
jgi:hypothetical protein